MVDYSKLIPQDIEKIDRNAWLSFMDVTPNESTMDLAAIGIGITDYGIEYNPQVDQEKWIIELNARNIHKSNQKQGSATQTAYKGDPVFEFVAAGRDKLNYKTHLVDVDIWNGSNGSYPAKMTNGMVTITRWFGEEANVEYSLYYNGDPIEGTVTFDSTTGKPTFTPTVSL